jgi:hypothetical protein
MPTTYEPIATTTLGSAAQSVRFSSVPTTYTDLVIIGTGRSDSSTSGDSVFVFFNNDDFNPNYSGTRLSGNGSAASSARTTNNYPTLANIAPSNSASGVFSFFKIDIFNYRGSTNKTVLSESSNDLNGSGDVLRAVGLWRSTAAITTISVACINNLFAANSTFTLYGIKNA